jgi:hypothetical protein
MRFEFETSFREQYSAALTMMSRMPLQMLALAIFPLAGFALILLSLATDSLSLFTIFLVVLTFSFFPLVTALNVWLSRRRNKIMTGQFVYNIDEQGIQVTGGVFESKLAWQALWKVVETKRFFFFFVSGRMAQFVPKRAIGSEEQLLELRKLVLSQTAK